LLKKIAGAEGGTASAPPPGPAGLPQARRGWRDYVLLLALACCWSSTYPLTKIGIGSIPPITFISARSLIAALFLLIILRARGIRIPTDARAWKLFAQQQTINSTIPFLMITWAQQYVPAASTVVLASTTPIFAFLITRGITRHEPATLLKFAGAVLGLAGTAVIIGLDALGGLGATFSRRSSSCSPLSPLHAPRSSDCGCPNTTRWWWRRARCCSAVWCCCRRR
jgi:drug/metabolite transporter (DMT)-like permease